MKSNVVQKGEKRPTKNYYLAWLAGIMVAVGLMIKKFHKQIEWHIVIPFTWIAVVFSYFWQTLHNHYPGDLDRGISGWMFYDSHILTSKLVFGGVAEDILLFHPFGMIFGVLLALYVFKIFKKEEETNKVLKISVFSFMFAILFSAAIFIDKSALYSFIIFALPAIPCVYICIDMINLKRFLLFYVAMLLFTFIWDFTSVYLPLVIWDEYARCWFYVKDGVHSELYNNRWFILGEMPFSIDVIYPGCGMMFLVGATGYIKRRYDRSSFRLLDFQFYFLYKRFVW
jgi:hypothetical protein